MNQSLRLRLTLLVIAVFAFSLLAAGAMARTHLRRTLESDARTALDSVLQDHVGANGSQPLAANGEVTRVFYLDEDGNEVTQSEFDRLVLLSIEQEMANGTVFATPLPGEAGTVVEMGPLPAEALTTTQMEALIASLPPTEAGIFETVSFEVLESSGNPTRINLGDDRFGVTQVVSIGDESLVIGVSTPRAPIEASISTFTSTGLLLIPLLTALVGVATWATTSRALRPVEAIRRQVEQIDPSSLDHHVAQPGGSDEIDRLARTMNDMLDRLHNASQRQRQFISDASHELRSPITATLATIETTNRSTIANDWPELSSTLANEQHQLANIVDDLLLLATLDERQPVMTDDVDLDELALREARREHPVPITVAIDQPHRRNGNAHLLERCIANLVENAAQHASTRVEVRLMTDVEGRVVVRVDDDGPGIDRQDRERVFDRFTRLDYSRNRRDGGTGLGLAIARDIAERHDATILVSTSDLDGARFDVVFEQTQENQKPRYLATT